MRPLIRWIIATGTVAGQTNRRQFVPQAHHPDRSSQSLAFEVSYIVITLKLDLCNACDLGLHAGDALLILDQ